MVIGTDIAYLPLVLALNPDKNLVQQVQQPSDFIVIRDVKSREDLHKLSYYSNCIIISSTLFEEKWTEDEYLKQALEYRRVHFKSRKKTLTELKGLKGQEFVDALLRFMFTGELPLEEEDTVSLFETIGSLRFAEEYLKMIEKQPEPKVQASVFTFLQKTLNEANDSLYYRKKRQQFGTKLKANLVPALATYKRSDKSSLDFINLVVTLTR